MWETIDAVANLEVNPAIGVDVVLEAVFVEKFCWDVAQLDADVLRSVQGCLEVKFLMPKVTNLAPFHARAPSFSPLTSNTFTSKHPWTNLSTSASS